jgi:peptidoglycan/xylan/chitin deacetylase (PgdA/CDA1 family)/CelD/BcsL family acetyltransferase involved in cellulose biosynthesis
MKVVELRQETDLEMLRPLWEKVLCESAANAIFLTWEWVTAWWSAYGVPGELRILAAFDETGTLRGIAPLRAQKKRKYGQTVSTLSFIGDGSNDSDYLDFIIASGYERQTMESFGGHLAAELDRGTVITLNEIPASSPNVPFLKVMAESRGLLWMESDVPCGTVRLPQTWEEFLALLKPRFRTKVRSVLRNLENRIEVRQEFCKNMEQAERLLPALFDLHTRRWVEDGKPGVFGWEQKRHFYHGLSKRLLERGWLRFSSLEWKDRILACQYGFVYSGVYSQLQEGYEPASEHWNVGIGLRAWTIKEFLKEGVREYDFLGGVGRHKTDWGADVKQSKQILLADKSCKNFVYCRGPKWAAYVRENARMFIPERILEMRKRRIAHRSAALIRGGFGEHVAEDSGNSRLRKAVASFYFYLRLPVLTRPLRDHYRLSISRPGKLPRISWSRRSEPAGRILYYHRVNDDADPFFPAMSTARFEREMAYLARNYKVVSLAEMLDRLDAGSPTNLVAITFDDGYQDNYRNAFPILQRYGLPATIFLTTGGIDSREPLWFERLALAFKRTERESLDLEADFPRRLWLRTPAERLESNNQTFRLLKNLPDEERRVRLGEILTRLGAYGCERDDKMLTWDQVRYMRARRIDFGGHTVTHPFISKSNHDNVAWEVSECKRRIEEELQAPATFFAYPNGREDDFNIWNKELVRGAGYRAALTTIWGLNYRSTDRMALKRGGPWEEDLSLFAYKLDWYQLINE